MEDFYDEQDQFDEEHPPENPMPDEYLYPTIK